MLDILIKHRLNKHTDIPKEQINDIYNGFAQYMKGQPFHWRKKRS